MFFSRIGRWIAWIGFVFALVRLALAVAIAVGTETNAAMQAMARRYLAAPNTGEVIGDSLMMILGFVALGTVCELALALHRQQG